MSYACQKFIMRKKKKEDCMLLNFSTIPSVQNVCVWYRLRDTIDIMTSLDKPPIRRILSKLRYLHSQKARFMPISVVFLKSLSCVWLRRYARANNREYSSNSEMREMCH